MSLPQWLRQFAQKWLPCDGKQGSRGRDVAAMRRRVLPHLEELEDRLTPSGDVLAFTTAAQNVGTYASSQPITVQLQDGSGKLVTAASNVTVNLSSTSSGGQFLDASSGMALTHPSLTIPKGASSVRFEYKDTQTGMPTLQAKAPALNLSASQQEAVGVELNFGLPSLANLNPGQPSQPISVELYDPTRGPFVAPSAVTVQLTSSSSTGQFLDASGKPLSNGRLIIPTGASSANFEYIDSKASISMLSASLDGSVISTQVNVGTSLVFSTPAQTIKAGQPSGTITLQLQDGHGKAVTSPATLSFFLSSNSQTGQILDGSGNPFGPLVSIPAGSSSVSFKYEDSVGGKPTLTANVSWMNLGLSATQQETVAGPYRVVLGMPGRAIAQDQPSQPITIQLLDSTGNAATTSSAVTVQLSSSSSTGQFLDASGKSLSNGRLTIPAGASSAGFEYKDSKAGFPTLTVSANGLTSQQQVNVGVSLAFTTPAQTLKAGKPSGTITVQLQDSNGKAVITPGGVPLYLSFNSQSGQLLDASGNPLPYYPSFAIPAGSSSFNFEYVDSMGGKPTFTATAGLMGGGTSISATQQETVVGPYRLQLETPPSQMIPQNEPSQPIAVQLIDSTGMAAQTTSALTIQLSSSSSTGQFFDASGKPLPNGRLIIPAGAGSASFEYKDNQAGFPTLTASENGFTSQGQVNVGVSLAFTTPAQNLKAGQPSGTMTVQLQDSNGKAFIAPGVSIVSLSSNSLTGQFLDSSGNQFLSPNLTIPAGSSSFSFKYKDSMGGKPTLTAGVYLTDGAGLSARQHETVTGPYRAVFPPVQQTSAIAQNEPSQPITIQLQDSTGNVATATSAVTVQLSSSSSTGQFLDASGKALSNGRLIIPAGASSAGFEYKDSQAGLPTLTASANGFSSPTQVAVGLSLAFTTPAQTLKSGQVSQPITVQLQDSHGKAFTTPNALPITLNSSLPTVQFLNAGPAFTPSSILIPAGSSSASFEITSNWGGKATLTASVSGMPLSVAQQETIQGLSGVVFTTSPQTLAAGQKSQRVTLQLQDNNGKAAVAPSGGLTIYLSGNSFLGNPTVQFFDANGKPILPIGTFPYFSTAITLPAGSSTVSFEFETTQAGSLPLVAGFADGPGAKQVETIQAGPPYSLVFLTPAQTLATGAPSGSVTVQLQDQYGNPIAAGSGGVTFNLHSSSSGGAFLSADGDPLASSTITLPQGLSSATFEYKDSRAGTPTLTASAKGISGSQKESITPVSAEIHVTNTKDSGSGSLRAAIEKANVNPGSTIVFDSGVTGTIDLLSALPTITANTNILGPGANLFTIERSAAAQTDFGIFVVGTDSNAAPPVVVLSGLTVANATGTGITNMGYLTLQRMVVKNNQAPISSWPNGEMFPYGSPGGIENSGTLTVLNSTIANNSTTSAAGVAAGIDSHGSVLIVNSTITGNKGTNYSLAGGIEINGTALIENSTISGNSAGQWSSSSGGLDSNNAQAMLYDTLVAGNTGSSTNPTDVSGPFISLGHNLIGEAIPQSSGFVGSDRVGTTAKPIDPKLGALSNNGGPTPTLALQTGSPAIGAGSSVNAPATDQRGDPRPQGADDIGAFERTTS